MKETEPNWSSERKRKLSSSMALFSLMKRVAPLAWHFGVRTITTATPIEAHIDCVGTKRFGFLAGERPD